VSVRAEAAREVVRKSRRCIEVCSGCALVQRVVRVNFQQLKAYTMGCASVLVRGVACAVMLKRRCVFLCGVWLFF